MPYQYEKIRPELFTEHGLNDVVNTLNFIAKSPSGILSVGDIVTRKDCVGDSWRALACIQYLEERGVVIWTRNEEWTADGAVIWKGRR